VFLTSLIYGLVAAMAETVGGAIVVLRRQWPGRTQEYLLALSAGFILALVFLELIPESIEAAGAGAPIAMLAGYAALHFVEHTIVGHLHFGEETHHEVMITRAASMSTFGGLFLHSFFDGFAIGAALQFEHALGILVFVAVLLHKIPEGLTIASVMLAARHSRRTALIASAAVGCATLLGVAAVPIIARDSEILLGYALAFSAGIATYVGATDLVPEINASRNRVVPVVVFAGFLLLYMGRAILTWVQ